MIVKVERSAHDANNRPQKINERHCCQTHALQPCLLARQALAQQRIQTQLAASTVRPKHCQSYNLSRTSREQRSGVLWDKTSPALCRATELESPTSDSHFRLRPDSSRESFVVGPSNRSEIQVGNNIVSTPKRPGKLTMGGCVIRTQDGVSETISQTIPPLKRSVPAKHCRDPLCLSRIAWTVLSQTNGPADRKVGSLLFLPTVIPLGN